MRRLRSVWRAHSARPRSTSTTVIRSTACSVVRFMSVRKAMAGNSKESALDRGLANDCAHARREVARERRGGVGCSAMLDGPLSRAPVDSVHVLSEPRKDFDTNVLGAKRERVHVTSLRSETCRNRRASAIPASGTLANSSSPVWKSPLALLRRPIAYEIGRAHV